MADWWYNSETGNCEPTDENGFGVISGTYIGIPSDENEDDNFNTDED